MIYLASPYTDPDPFVRERRYIHAMEKVWSLLQRNKIVYSPVVHCHELAKIAALPKDAAFWTRYNFAMLALATKLAVLRIDGWRESPGVAAEIEEANRLNLPVEYL